MKKIFNLKDWRIEEETGYKPITTFYLDFSIAEMYGVEGIKDTYRRGIQEAICMGYKELTEFVMALNWKIWEHHKSNIVFEELYDTLWKKADKYALDHLKGEELSYFYRTTD